MNLILESDGTLDVERNIDGLYRLPLHEFTAARQELSAAVRQAGRKEEAARVKQLKKPSLAAWALNQVWWGDRQAFRSLLDAGSRLLSEQQASLGGRPADLRQAVERRQAALAQVVALAVRALGGPARVSAQVHQQLISTCEGLASGTVVAGAEPGRLTDDLAPTGMDALVTMLQGSAPAAAAPRMRTVATVTPFTSRPKAVAAPAAGPPDTREADRERRAREAQQRRDAIEAAHKAEKDARARLVEAEHELQACRKTHAAAERTLERSAERLDAARQELAEREQEAEAAQRTFTDALRRLTSAEQAVKEQGLRAAQAQQRVAEEQA